jgi:lipopolysaccharide transport system permease protein
VVILFASSGSKALSDIYRYRHLLYQLIKRDISSRYQGTFIGIAWSFFFPVVTLAVYALVFGVILTPRWPNVSDPSKFTLILFSGLLVFNFFSECTSRASSLIIANANYVKKVVFPVGLLIWVPIGTALFHLILGMVAWALLVVILGGQLYWTFLLTPVVLLPLVILTAGLSWLLAAFGVFVRDIGQVITVLVQLLMYLGPIIYPREVLPQKYQWLMQLNPITIPVEQFRNLLNIGVIPDIQSLGLYTLVALGVAWVGKLFFDKTRHGFADVI